MTNKIPEKVPAIEYKKILYTTDLSESGRYAFHHAASLARHYDAELTVIHVVEGGPELDRRLFGYVDEELWEEIKTRNLEEAKDMLIKRKRDNAAIRECIGQFCDDIQSDMPEQPDVTYNVEVKMGEPVQQIIEEAERGRYDIIVMGRHGDRPIKTAVVGDVVRRVVRHTDIPVLIVKVPEDDE